MRTKSLIFYTIDLWMWISKTIAKISPKCTKDEWDDFWFETYKELSGKSKASGTKNCPKNAAYCLYKLGRIKEGNIPFNPLPYKDITEKIDKGGYGKNGCYAIIALDCLKDKPSLTLNKLWQKIRDIYNKKIGKKPAKTNQGAVTVTYKLFHNNKLNL